MFSVFVSVENAVYVFLLRLHANQNCDFAFKINTLKVVVIVVFCGDAVSHENQFAANIDFVTNRIQLLIVTAKLQRDALVVRS